jgi:hypothetical protein
LNNLIIKKDAIGNINFSIAIIGTIISIKPS